MESVAASPADSPVSTAGTLLAFLNHLLRGNPWALERLQQFAGKTARFDITPFHFAFTIGGNGELAPAGEESTLDASVTATLPLLLRILAMREPDIRLAEIAGDPALLGEIAYVTRHLAWDMEEDLSRLVGDAAAHRLAGTGKKLLGWPGAALFGFAGALAEYWTEEKSLLARPEDAQRWLREVALLAAEADLLEKRLERLERS